LLAVLALLAAAFACADEPGGDLAPDAAGSDVRLHIIDPGGDAGEDAGDRDGATPDARPDTDGGTKDEGTRDVPAEDAADGDDASLDAGVPGDAGDAGADGGSDAGAVETGALVEVYALDIWARPLAAGRLSVLRPGGTAQAFSGFPVATMRLETAGKYAVTLESEHHDDARFEISYDGTDSPAALKAGATAGTAPFGLSVSHDRRDTGGPRKWAHTVYAGLKHHYFAASGRPPREGTKTELLMDGEEAWQKVHESLQSARGDVMLATWWWQSDFELLRPWATHAQMTPEERRENSILWLLTSIPARVRLLVGQFWGQDGMLKWLTADPDLEALAEDPRDGFEFMGQANESEGVFEVAVPPVHFSARVWASIPQAASRSFDAEEPVGPGIDPYTVDMTDFPGGLSIQIASFHQKFLAIDGREAFVGGMNVKSTDWDSSAHLIYDHRRMEFESDTAARQEVSEKAREPDLGPRKDYMLFMEGPAAADVLDVFHRRWKYLLDTGAEFSQNSTDFLVPEPAPAVPGGVTVQMTATLPSPFDENSIWESQVGAVRHAGSFIFIEDQYFRAPLLFDEIAARMREVPGLVLIVVTKPVSEWTDPGCRWTAESHLKFVSEFPDRYLMLQLRSFDTVVTWGVDETESRFSDMDVHSKMLIVDDLYMSVGSCNKNNRGLLYEGEANVSVMDAAFVTAARKRIVSNLLDSTVPDETPQTMLARLRAAAEWNDAVYANWEAEGFDINLGDGTDPLPVEYAPAGFAYSLDFRDPKECLIEEIGPDVTFW
jgi:hypothetical protein